MCYMCLSHRLPWQRLSGPVSVLSPPRSPLLWVLCWSPWWHSHHPNKLTLWPSRPPLSTLGPRWLTGLLLRHRDWPHSEKTSLVLCVLRVPTIFFLTVDRSNSRRKFNFLVHTRKIERILNLSLYSCYNVTKYCYLSLRDDAGEPD